MPTWERGNKGHEVLQSVVALGRKLDSDQHLLISSSTAWKQLHNKKIHHGELKLQEVESDSLRPFPSCPGILLCQDACIGKLRLMTESL